MADFLHDFFVGGAGGAGVVGTGEGAGIVGDAGC